MVERAQLVNLLNELFGPDDWPRPLHLLRGVILVEQGQSRKMAARAIGTTEQRLSSVLDAHDPVAAVLGVREVPPTQLEMDRRRDILGQLILGKAAELAFEDIYKSELGESEFALDDYRVGRTDTDYRMLNGNRRPVYRINIKFFGSLFRNAKDFVDLDPEDCFPLATYKIYAALQKQQEEHLPYIFLVVSVPTLTAKSIGEGFTSDEISPIISLLLSRVERKRDIEDRFADLQASKRHTAFVAALDQIRAAKWYVLSARRADKLLRHLLFERVFAVRIRGFAQSFRNAELDMHFSLKSDLRELHDFLRILREGGLQRSTSMLERGDI